MSPMVFTFRHASFRLVDLPTKSRSEDGSGQMRSRQLFSSKTVTASGFFMSEPSLAKILLKDTPMDTVRPISSFMVWRICSAIS